MKKWTRNLAAIACALSAVAVAQSPPQTIRLSCDDSRLTIRLPEPSNHVQIEMRYVMQACLGRQP